MPLFPLCILLQKLPHVILTWLVCMLWLSTELVMEEQLSTYILQSILGEQFSKTKKARNNPVHTWKGQSEQLCFTVQCATLLLQYQSTVLVTYHIYIIYNRNFCWCKYLYTQPKTLQNNFTYAKAETMPISSYTLKTAYSTACWSISRLMSHFSFCCDHRTDADRSLVRPLKDLAKY